MTSLIPLLILTHSLGVKVAEACRFKVPSVRSLVVSGLQNFIEEAAKQNERLREEIRSNQKRIDELQKSLRN